MRRAAMLLFVLLLVVSGCRSNSDQKDARVPATAADPGDLVAVAVTPPSATATPEPPAPTATPEPEPEPPAPPPPVSEPARVRIPKLRVDARIVPVGVNRLGEMESPADAWSVAWFAPGYKPSEPGNAVLAGHVDYIRVGPAVFFNVRTLAPGDRIFVTAVDAIEYEFEVKAVERYFANAAPVDRIFGPNPNRGLNLITCGGTFNARTLEYDQRIVVYSEQVAPQSRLMPVAADDRAARAP